MDPRDLLLASFHAAVAEADPLRVLPAHLPRPPKGRTVVIGAGKAAASMALAVERHWPADSPLEGVVVTRYRHALPTTRIRVVEAGHPIPDVAGAAAAREVAGLVAGLSPDDLLIALISGGGSSLLNLPADSLPMPALQATTRDLLRCGATIQEINTVRKHLSAVQGGRLAAACAAPVLALIISDVAGDDPTHIASGPFAPDPTTFQDAIDVFRRHGVQPPAEVSERLENGRAGRVSETPKPGDPVFRRVENRVIATAGASLEAGARVFRGHGIMAAILGDTVTGEAREVAKVYGALARQCADRSAPWQPPVALISGGELTVTVRGAGKGGRCTAFLLGLALDLAGRQGIEAIACDTDGIDGTEDNAGALITPETLSRAAALGLSPQRMLDDNDSYTLFEQLGDLIVTGPTRTNVNDYRAILVGASAA